jgi:hypothetical protein
LEFYSKDLGKYFSFLLLHSLLLSDQEIVNLIGLEEDVMNALIPSLYECHSLQVFTQLQVRERRRDSDEGFKLKDLITL